MRRFRVLIYIFLPIMLATTSIAQELRTYYVTCDSAEFAYIITHPEEIFYIDCTFEYEGQVWSDARIRLRGESSLYYPKKSFKVNFDADNRFYDRDKMNLISEWDDPSYSHEYLAYDLYQRAGLPASLTWFARFYVNGDYLGLYLDIEQVDEFLLARAGLPEDASIYKADGYGCVLSTTEAVEELWEKKTNEQTGFYDLHNLIEWLDTTPDYEFFQELGQLFSAPELARAIAVNSLIGNQSTYYHNYYLIHDLSQGGFWRMLPWDMDGTYEYWYSYENPEYYRCGHQLLSTVNVLIRRCWKDESMRTLIFDQMEGLMDSLFVESYYEEMTDSLASLLYDAVVEDTLKQFTAEEFLAALADIPVDVVGRSARITEKSAHDPLPFDLQPALITPTGVYFSWDSTTVADGSPVTYEIWLGDNKSFTGDVTILSGLTGTSLLYDALEPGSHYWRVYAQSNSGGEMRTLTFYSKVEIESGAFTGTTVTGSINASTTWDREGSPYSLPEGLTVASGAILTIEPGVLVGIGPEQSIIIHGGLTAIGTADDSIHFVPLNPESNWGSLIVDNPSDEVNLSFISMTRGSNDPSGPIPNPGAMIQVTGGEIDIFDSHLSWGSHGAVAVNQTSIHLERVSLDHFSFDMVLIHYGSALTMRSCRLAFGASDDDLLDIGGAYDSSEIIACSFYGCGDDIVDVDNVHYLEISSNFITGAGDKGISIGDGSDEISVTNNIVTDCKIGIGIKTASSAILYNNAIACNDTGLAILPESGENGEVTVYNSALWLNDTEIYTSPGANLNVEYSLVGGVEPYPGQGNINTDPYFTDQWNGNFYPLESSPLIDAGYGTGHPEYDFNDSARYDVPSIPNTGAGEVPYVDIGVYEYYPFEPAVKPQPRIPESYVLLENYPNPFNAFTRINFSIIAGDWAEIEIYNVLGQRVFTRRFERQRPGQLSILWNGYNESGLILSSGVYICRLRQESGNAAVKMILLK